MESAKVRKEEDILAGQKRPDRLWLHADFLKVWAGQTISLCGSQVTLLAFPLTAILLLHASAAQMGFLQAAQYAPFLLIGIFVGVWVDRFRRRPIMIIADLARFLLLGYIPLAAFFHFLNIFEMYAIAFVVGSLATFFDVAYRSYLPSLIDRSQLVDGNSKLELTSSMAQLIGPGLGGFLVQLLTAPISLLADALSFLISAFSLSMVHTVEPPIARSAEKTSMIAEIRQGLNLLLRNSILGPIVGSSINITLFLSMYTAVYILYATNVLHLSPIILGVIYAVGGLAAIPGAMVSKWITERIGVGKTMIVAVCIYGCSALLIPLAGGSQLLITSMLILWQALTGVTFVIWNINQLSLRQALTPNALLGRINASYRFLVWGVLPIGALVGGALGTLLGLHTTLLIGTIGLAISPVWLLLSPVRRLKMLPVAPVEDTTLEGEFQQ